MPSELKNKLNRCYWEGDPQNQPNRIVPITVNEIQGIQNSRNTNFGSEIQDLRALVVHTTAGWPRRSLAKNMVNNLRGNRNNTVFGYQFRISGDATVYRSLDLEVPRITFHATHVNNWALGVSIGNLLDVQPASATNNHWAEASSETNDIPGAKLWLTRGNGHNEVTPCWWTTEDYTRDFPGRRGMGGTDAGSNLMLYSEKQYRSLSLLAKYVLEKFNLPRNFPLLPHVVWSSMYDKWDAFRRNVLADERVHMMVREFYNMGNSPIRPSVSMIDENNPDTELLVELYKDNDAELRDSYLVGTNNNTSRNRGWRKFFDVYRGLHGHGITQGNRVDCPGPLFNWHRFAREVWEWWWYPFDIEERNEPITRPENETVEMSGRVFRGYRNFDENTPLIEYYWDEQTNESTFTDLIIPDTINGQSLPGASPATFKLKSDTPIYAMSNGELIAAKIPENEEQISTGFILIKHKVFHNHATENASVSDQINYNIKPSVVYSLYMHLSHPSGISFDEPTDHNPDWLNRVLKRKKECDLGIDFYNANRNATGFGDNRWEDRPPTRNGYATRPTTYESWISNQRLLGRFLHNLKNGNIAIPEKDQNAQTINILLGDYLGDSGSIDDQLIGVHIEIFSPSFSPHDFSVITGSGWDSNIHPDGELVSALYESEWKDTKWWQEVYHHMSIDTSLPLEDKIPKSGSVYHFHPFQFMKWVNNMIWRHEWPKYQVKDSDGNDISVEDRDRPRTRRISPA